MMVPWYLITSLAYYHYNVSLISDELYDHLCRRLLRMWDGVRHKHKWLISKKSLEAGTGYDLTLEDYPGVVIGATRNLLAIIEAEESARAVKLARRQARKNARKAA